MNQALRRAGESLQRRDAEGVDFRPFRMGQQRPCQRRLGPDIGVQRQDPFGMYLARLQPGLEAVCLAVDVLRHRRGVDEAHALIPLGVAPHEVLRTVGRAAVDDEDLRYLRPLRHRAIQAWGQACGLVEHRDQDGDEVLSAGLVRPLNPNAPLCAGRHAREDPHREGTLYAEEDECEEPAHHDRAPAGALSAMRSSAIFAELSTPGRPAPGCVPAPTK